MMNEKTEKLTTKEISKMTKSQRNFLKEQLFEEDKKNIEKELEEIKGTQNKIRCEIDILKEDKDKARKDIDELKEQTNVLCAPIHHKRRKKFAKKASSRVKFLLGDKTAPDYILFSPYFFKGIYSDIAYQLELGNWDDVSMEEYENLNSKYEQAKEIRDNWKPQYTYFKRCLNELIEKRDNGNLPKERCRALTEFLELTDNGKNVPFL